jgi:hypothetical protein
LENGGVLISPCSQASEWEILADDLRAFVSGEARQIGVTEYGTKHEVRGELAGPGGRSAAIVTAWIVLRGEDLARFVSAYPEDGAMAIQLLDTVVLTKDILAVRQVDAA